MTAEHAEQALAYGVTTSDLVVPFLCGATGILNATTTGAGIEVPSKPALLLCGMRTDGTILPVQVDATGQVQLA